MTVFFFAEYLPDDGRKTPKHVVGPPPCLYVIESNYGANVGTCTVTQVLVQGVKFGDSVTSGTAGFRSLRLNRDTAVRVSYPAFARGQTGLEVVCFIVMEDAGRHFDVSSGT